MKACQWALLIACGSPPSVVQTRLSAGLNEADVVALAVYVVEAEQPTCDDLRATPIASGREDVEVRFYRRVDKDAALDFRGVTPMSSARVVIDAFGSNGDIVAVGCSEPVALVAGAMPTLDIVMLPR